MDRTPRTNGRQAEKSEAAMARALEAALELFSSQGYGATSMRQISNASQLSVGNLYHHFGSKDAIFQRLIEDYWSRLGDPESPLQQIFRRAGFPDDLEEMAIEIRRSVEQNVPYIKLIYIDVIEFEGEHIRTAYEMMADQFAEVYSEKLDQKKAEGAFGDIDPLVAVMFATRWFFYFYMVEECFGVPMHFGMSEEQAVDEVIRILRHGVLPRPDHTRKKRLTGKQRNRSRGVESPNVKRV
jgi:AcrR family transcriptional regulator